MASSSTCQPPFQDGMTKHGGSALPSVCRAAPPERSASSSRRSATTEARALKVQHSEAERRRRERINAHLATLRRMIVPDTKQMDKATLLASAINHLKDLMKRRASEAAPQPPPIPVPAEANGITVDSGYTTTTTGVGVGDGRTAVIAYIKASISCDDRPGLLADIAAAVRGLGLRPVRAEVASLGGRTRCSFVLCRVVVGGDVGLLMMIKPLEEAVRQALATAAFSEVVQAGCSSSRNNKRQRILDLEPSFLYSAMN